MHPRLHVELAERCLHVGKVVPVIYRQIHCVGFITNRQDFDIPYILLFLRQYIRRSIPCPVISSSTGIRVGIIIEFD